MQVGRAYQHELHQETWVKTFRSQGLDLGKSRSACLVAIRDTFQSRCASPVSLALSLSLSVLSVLPLSRSLSLRLSLSLSLSLCPIRSPSLSLSLSASLSLSLALPPSKKYDICLVIRKFLQNPCVTARENLNLPGRSSWVRRRPSLRLFRF